MSHHVRTKSTENCTEQLAVMASDTYAETDDNNKRFSARVGVDPSTTSRRRKYGLGPVRDVIEYVRRLTAREAMRVAQTVLAAARMVALSTKTTPELIALYWDCRRHEVEKEARDRAMEALPVSEWDWTEGANATARDGAVEILKEAVQRLFAARKVSPQTVAAYAGRAH